MRNRSTRLARLLSVPLALAATAPAHAVAEYCVDTIGGIADALDTAETNGQADVVRIVAGTYLLSTGFSFTGQDAFDLIIEGGYAPGCGTRSASAAATVFDGGGASGLLRISWSGNVTASVVVRGLTLRNGLVTSGAALAVAPGFAGGNILIEQVILTGNRVTTGDYVLQAFGQAAGTTTVRNTVVADNRMDRSNRAAIGLSNPNPSFDSTGRFTNNTVVRNRVGPGQVNATGGVALQGNEGNWVVANSIIRDNDAVDIEGSRPVLLLYNVLGVNELTAINGFSAGNTGVDPVFRDDASIELDATSPLIDAGLPIVPGADGVGAFDVFGSPRDTGIGVDIGAHEAQYLLVDGFESP